MSATIMPEEPVLEIRRPPPAEIQLVGLQRPENSCDVRLADIRPPPVEFAGDRFDRARFARVKVQPLDRRPLVEGEPQWQGSRTLLNPEESP